jgi:hypothetical protein
VDIIMTDLTTRLQQLSPSKLKLLSLLRSKQDGAVKRYPLSYAQQRLWFIDQLDPGNPTYNLAVGLLLTGNLDETVLQRSVSEIVRRHESLRTSFPTRQGEPCQEVAPAGDLPIEKLDLRDLEEQERQTSVKQLVLEKTQTRCICCNCSSKSMYFWW